MDAVGDVTGKVLDGRYTVLRHIADGGMAAVYVARDERLSREVALKIMHPNLAQDPERVASFRHEAQSIARLDDPHVVAVLDQGDDGDLVFLTMEFLRGTTLRARLHELGAFTPREALKTLDGILAGLSAAHKLGIVHRDITPSNVMIRHDGIVKVTDFGLAAAVGAAAAGYITLAYAAPEQRVGGVSDPRTDVYAAGLVLAEMLTGKPAYDNDGPPEGATSADIAAIDAELPSTLVELVAAATATNHLLRPADAAEFRDRAREVHQGLTDEELDRLPPAALERPAAQETPAPHDSTQKYVSDATQSLAVIGSPETRKLPVITPPSAPEEKNPKKKKGWKKKPAAAKPARATRPKNTKRRIQAGIVAAVMVAVISTGSWFFTAGPGGAVDIPTLAGVTRKDAEAALNGLGLESTVTQEYSETVPSGSVIRTEPPAGTATHRQDPVTLIVSGGPERYNVPELAGSTPDAAAKLLEQNHLVLGKRTKEWNEKVPAGTVISSKPAAGTSLRPGTEVSVVVSRGREPISVDDFTGRSLSDATAELERRGLRVRVTGKEFSDRVPPNAVLRQSPSGGKLHRGDTVEIVVSKGPDVVNVPDVSGMSEADARNALESAGLAMQAEKVVGGLFDTVRSTDPAPGTAVPRGSVIKVYVV
ncbi:Stk1 family PASTA domain-containing Ser/Thr kinase [Dermatophilus congolensis]|uniref:Stk1 family PASTA domain-containing Ser/Thr kinase n=1 Tax=Dermatophilus congolensis TaxID=1863 RepID=UPI001AAFB853|nr:Stk1 family PASTA domain-containing Ser/Thr kinase [Dermatophilus congolensis]MBO3143022.1 Stk1 family PASTA domain-containing Ser/Thr kinase [Dermatophilus congolensis]MBO3152010.1 Stk1 family PASTA domain-containing Ser/Thr kinase [Dermatophilus congolensis]MBO3160981.1 Stk1 family PASTA domain-containing Ser/Thr kinase [Dermatophilus congolensis]MBO3163295.1 Stk1 family PASTA domain-containing Ser/Thr kinase [Dermatophilus congolensis]MBO3176852.1 Stk1 family PASTA domain-containing Ser/